MQQAKELTLANLDGGALMELATREFRKICENIADPNVSNTAKRKLTIGIEISPDAKAQKAKVSYSVKATLPGADKAETHAFIAMAPGADHLSLFGVDVRQEELFPEVEMKPQVVESRVVNM